ncbi:MAG: ATP-binding protein, partial [Gammaproteobacteria bacterium]|nr:ATP-binding protein [Gammaproteobacteria bacterium]
MSIIVGQAVRNNDFWDRADELEDIWDAIESGSHILISAPRRVGKTSIMYKILDEPKVNYIPIYIDTESADSQNEFWQKLFHKLLEAEFVNSLKASEKNLWSKLTTIKIKKISATGVELGDGELLDYKEAFKRLIKDLDSDKKLIIMIDEFAQTIENIIKYEDTKNAISLLKAHRELRQDIKFSQKVSFIYAGSIGLESVVATIGASKHINDLNSIKISPLSLSEAQEFTQQLCSKNNITITHNEIMYLLNKIEWLIPFYIQLISQEIKKLHRKDPKVTAQMIDQAIANALDHRQYFETWLSKIKTAFKNNDYLFAKEILNNISENKMMNSLNIAN